MRRSLISALAGLAALVAAEPVLADCVDQVPSLKARIAREQDTGKAGAARKQLAIAQQNLRGSESECRNAVIRANRILNEQPAQQGKLPPGQRQTEPAPGKPWNSIR
jgi:hypothetical protein